MKNMKLIMENFNAKMAEAAEADVTEAEAAEADVTEAEAAMEEGDMPGDADSAAGVADEDAAAYDDFLRHLASMADDADGDDDTEPLEEGQEEGGAIPSRIEQEIEKMSPGELDDFIQALVEKQREAADGRIDDLEADEAAEARADMHDYAGEREEDEYDMNRP
jgi:hypothetical protein